MGKNLIKKFYIITIEMTDNKPAGTLEFNEGQLDRLKIDLIRRLAQIFIIIYRAS